MSINLSSPDLLEQSRNLYYNKKPIHLVYYLIIILFLVFLYKDYKKGISKSSI